MFQAKKAGAAAMLAGALSLSAVTLSDPQISPDGKKIAAVVSRIDVKTDKTPSRLELVDVATGTARVRESRRIGPFYPYRVGL